MELILKIKADDDLTLRELVALNQQGRNKNLRPESLASQYIREGIERDEAAQQIGESERGAQ